MHISQVSGSSQLMQSYVKVMQPVSDVNDGATVRDNVEVQ